MTKRKWYYTPISLTIIAIASLALVFEYSWALNLTRFYYWIGFLLILLGFFVSVNEKENKKESSFKPRTTPLFIDILFLLLIVGFVAKGFFILAVLGILSALFERAINSIVKEMNERKSEDVNNVESAG